MKRLVTGILSLSLMITLTVSPASAATKTDFTDVPKFNQFHDEIQYLVGEKVISGYKNGQFKPKENLTRGEATMMIGRMLKLDSAQRTTKFKDVPKSYAGSGYIASATKDGIISGYSDGTFRPNQDVTRGDMALIIAKAFKLRYQAHYSFTDINYQMKAYDSIRYLAGASITTGYADGSFKPYGKVTREQFSAFLARGMSPVYKQKAAMAGSYAANMTKQYTYTGADGEIVHTYKYVEKTMSGADLGYVWEAKNLTDGSINYYLQSENSDSLSSGQPESHSYIDLKYPVAVGKSWPLELTGNHESKITKIQATIKTPYKTFNNAVEVSNTRGYKTYYVQGVGNIKTIDPSGTVTSELKSIE